MTLINKFFKIKQFIRVAVLSALFMAQSLYADPLDLATIPLANSPSIVIQPNLMFILDDSGSMLRDYTPDYISSSIVAPPNSSSYQCRDSGDDDAGTVYPGVSNGGTRVLDLCVVGDVPYMNSDMNSQYYNPTIRYRPAVNGDGTSMPSQTDPTNVRTDAFNRQNTNQLLDADTFVNLTTEYPDRLWCTIPNPTNADRNNAAVCRKNSNYLYPNDTFKYGRSSGSPNQTVTENMLDELLVSYGRPYHYSVIPIEHCKSADLVDCTLSATPVDDFTFPAKSRWCNSTQLSDCRANRSGDYVWPRYPGSPGASLSATGSFRVTGANRNQNATISSIRVGGVEIMGSGGPGCAAAVSNSNNKNAGNRRTALASVVASRINSCASNPDYTAISSGDLVTITAVLPGSAGNGGLAVSGFSNGASAGSLTGLSGGNIAAAVPPYVFSRIDIDPVNNSYSKAGARTDCVGLTCTYQEEITNFGNWYTYYRTRMQGMKSASSLAFKDIGEDFRVGFMTINPTAAKSLNIATFNTSHKINWYNKFFSITPSGGTPLRRALSRAGRVFAQKDTISGAFSDPVQYSCQQNFALLTSDGYWNGDAGYRVDGSSAIGNQDGGDTPLPMNEGAIATSNSLSDVAKYYRDTDLRTGDLNNCDGSLGINVCQDPPPSVANKKQTMVTMTLGLGIDGVLAYTRDYKTATFGDFVDIKTGVKDWPVPVADSESALDDMWHAAVNGDGTFFSAKSPDDLAKSLVDALASIQVKVGAGAAAATSTLNPVSGDNFAYVASYTTGFWTGNLEKREINTDTGAVELDAVACVEDVLPTNNCTSPSSIQVDGDGYSCVTPNVTDPLACSVELDGTDCKVPVATNCNGKLKLSVSDFSDSRTIYMKSGSSLTSFNYANFAPAEKATYESPFLSLNLSQWTSLSPAQQAKITGDNLVKYLRGQRGYEENALNPENRIFRFRQAILGDLIDSRPAFIGKPTFSYIDPGYNEFKAAQAGRAKTVFAGANDGMLHAFNADTMEERWAYVPSMVIRNLWKLADVGYSNKHSYYVNGDAVISDICVSGCGGAGAQWKTILVAGLNGGGRGYYALDITNPSSPSLLWEFDASNEPNLGFTYGNPVITKRPDGQWVVLVTSGYNNIPDNSPFYDSANFKPNNPARFNTGNGQGYLYILNAATGAKLNQISTGVGSVANPSGLAKISAYAVDPEENNTATYVYGGDLLGNLWRFDLSDNSVSQFAQLEFSGAPQPITVKPELGTIKGKLVVFVGTGKYLEVSDLTNTDRQTLYGIKDTFNETAILNPRASLVEQVIAGDPPVRESTSNSAVNWDVENGWYVDLPDTGERQNVSGQLILGTLLIPTTVPTSSPCQPAGYGWLTFLDYRTGLAVPGNDDKVSNYFSSPIVGFNVVYIDGKPKVSVVTADNPTPQLVPNVPFSGSGSGFNKTRSIWRELIPQ